MFYIESIVFRNSNFATSRRQFSDKSDHIALLFLKLSFPLSVKKLKFLVWRPGKLLSAILVANLKRRAVENDLFTPLVLLLVVSVGWRALKSGSWPNFNTPFV